MTNAYIFQIFRHVCLHSGFETATPSNNIHFHVKSQGRKLK